MPSLTEKPGRLQSTGSQRVGQDWSDPVHINIRLLYFFGLWQLCPSESWAWRWCTCLACRDPGDARVFRNTDCFHSRSYGPISYGPIFSWASCSWQSEGLFGQSFSIASPVQALRGNPCLRFFSVVQCIRHIEGLPLTGVLLCRSVDQALKWAPWVGSYSVVQCVWHLMGQPLYCSAADAGMWRERGHGDGSTPYALLSSIALLPWLPGFLPQAYPIMISSLTSPSSVSLQSTAAVTLGLPHNP